MNDIKEKCEMDVKTIVDSVMETLLGFMKENPHFPGICYSTSQLMASYLVSRLSTELRVMCGTFGSLDLFHTWIEIDECILDFTLFQFSDMRLTKREYQKLSAQELHEHILKVQSSFWIDSSHPMWNLYKPLAEMRREYDAYAEAENHFNSYLDVLKASVDYRYSNWLEGKNTAGDKFREFLDKGNKRVTKRLFTKYAIVSK